MSTRFLIFFLMLIPFSAFNQDLSEGLLVNDLNIYPMQDVPKPNYLESFVDPSFGTTIRRITNAGTNNVIVPMYSTIQAWNADESLMILYDVTNNDDPDIFYYPDSQTDDFIKYTVSTQAKL